jgi:hypothetical protein
MPRHNAPATARGSTSPPVSGRRLVTEGTVDVTPGTELVEGPFGEGGCSVVLVEREGIVVVVWRGNNVTIVLPVVVVGDELVLDASDVDDDTSGTLDVDDELAGCDVVVDMYSVVDVLVVEVELDVDVVSSCVVVVVPWTYVGQTSSEGLFSNGP